MTLIRGLYRLCLYSICLVKTEQQMNLLRKSLPRGIDQVKYIVENSTWSMNKMKNKPKKNSYRSIAIGDLVL